ncbi:MAG: carboxypeptidase-like regulatory domain-containing protein, partial [Niastella sp.]|nr:carboxypeptidase-like regulatory domain-containing protein [Niastella sp.]
MKKVLYLLSFIFPLICSAFNNKAPAGTLKGRVMTSDNQAAPFVSIAVIGTDRNVVSDEEGYFNITKVPAGEQELEVTLIGYETLRQKVTVEDGKTTTVNLRITISNSQLQEVIVTNSKSKFVFKSSEYVARMQLRNLENPQVYNVVGRQRTFVEREPGRGRGRGGG